MRTGHALQAGIMRVTELIYVDGATTISLLAKTYFMTTANDTGYDMCGNEWHKTDRVHDNCHC